VLPLIHHMMVATVKK